MRLDKSRRALTLAEKYLEILEELTDDDPEAFRDSFVGAIAVIRRVGHAVDFESKQLGRTSQFSQWWKKSEEDRRHLCVKDVRDLVLHEATEEAQVRHEVLGTGTAISNVTAYNPAVITATAHIDVVRDGGQPERYTFSAMPTPPEAEQAGPTFRRTWVFANGSCAGDALLPALREYLKWMRDDVIPRAE
ncbi:hypothetical protein ABZ135_33435 [Streptomyces sp. NPDC006339]|uniref:hypothetical protein n=1 Tax=Streptomyces sp. NPDC006339 TaxID=3156755 RepID=UPI0033B985EB